MRKCWHQITLQRSVDNYDGLQGCLLYEWTNRWTLSIIRVRMLSAKSKWLGYFREGISNSGLHTQACPMWSYIQLYKYSVQKSKATVYKRARHCYLLIMYKRWENMYKRAGQICTREHGTVILTWPGPTMVAVSVSSSLLSAPVPCCYYYYCPLPLSSKHRCI